MNERVPDTELANAIRKLQAEIDEKYFILKTLREQYHGNETIKHGDYINSVAWQETRQKIFRRDGFRCVMCGQSTNLNVHHITYENLGAEESSDLATLCQKCHAKVHGKETVSQTEETKHKQPIQLGFSENEWALLVYRDLVGELDREDEIFELKPEYFPNIFASNFISLYLQGAYMGDDMDDLLSESVEIEREKTPDRRCTVDMYLALLLRVYQENYAEPKEKELIKKLYSSHGAKVRDEVRAEFGQIQDFLRKLRNRIGDL